MARIACETCEKRGTILIPNKDPKKDRKVNCPDCHGKKWIEDGLT